MSVFAVFRNLRRPRAGAVRHLHAPEIIRTLKDNPQPVVITLHGEAKAILQDVGQYEETQETLALLKVLALTNRQVEEGKLRPVAESFARIRKRLVDSQS